VPAPCFTRLRFPVKVPKEWVLSAATVIILFVSAPTVSPSATVPVKLRLPVLSVAPRERLL